MYTKHAALLSCRIFVDAIFLSFAIMSYVTSKERAKLLAFSLSRLKQQC